MFSPSTVLTTSYLVNAPQIDAHFAMRKAITAAVASESNAVHPGLGGPRQLGIAKGNSTLAPDDPKSVNVQGLTKLLWNQTQVSLTDHIRF